MDRQPLSKHPLHKVWRGMRARCNGKNEPSYKDYGGRGIRVCERWNVFANFLADMGERPPGLTLERKDNDGPYSPENCRWATRAEQRRNTRHTTLITFCGETKCLADWANGIGIERTALRNRLKSWPLELALTAKPSTVFPGWWERKFCRKGHEYTEANTRWYRGYRNCRACAHLQKMNDQQTESQKELTNVR